MLFFSSHKGDLDLCYRIGSKKKNWDLYPACLMEMGRICTPGTGRAVLLTQDKKCFAKVCSKSNLGSKTNLIAQENLLRKKKLN